MAEAVRRDVAKPDGEEPTSAQIAAGAHARGDTPDSTAGEEVPMGGPDTGVSGDAGEAWIYAQLRRVQAHRCQTESSEGEQEAEESEEQAIPTSGISGAEGAGGCEVRPCRVYRGWRKYYQFTAVDECTRWTYRQMYDEHSTYSAEAFLIELIQRCPFPIREIQTDNGTEFTKALISNDPNDKSLFELKLTEYDILYHRIRIATPRHNGKVERQHRIDQQRFYDHLRMFSLEDGRKQLAVYQKKSNDYIKHCLGLRSPNQVLADYLAVM